MVEVIGQDQSVAMEATCKGCGAKLRYYKKDLKRDYSTDYTGGRSYWNYIECPTCARQVVV